MHHSLDEIIQTLKQKETQLQSSLSNFLHNRSLQNSQNFQENLVIPLQKKILREKIAGVDSGFVDFNFSHLQVIAVRTTSAIYSFNEKLQEYSYYPHYYSQPLLFYSEKTVDSNDLTLNKNLIRLREEIQTAIETIEKHKPQYLYLDGSIVPQYSEKPAQNSKLKKEYEDLVLLFETLYLTAEKNNCLLIGCVEDSRGTRFTELLAKEINKDISLYDTQFLHYFLQPGERTSLFSYTPEKHPILMDFDEKYRNSIYVFYLKAGLDKPLRIEFLKKESAKEIAEITYTLSSIHRTYSYPSVLIEADLRSRLKPKEIDFIFNSIINRVGKGILMRRERRPF